MRPADYYIAKILEKITHSHEPVNRFYRKHGLKVGNGCLLCSYLLSKEAFLIEIGDNTTISTNVSFVTHDNSVKLVHPDKSDIFGKISIGDNCFVGENSTLLYGITIGNRVIIAAGSVVTKSFLEEEIIIGGNPARKIGDWNTFRKKTKSFAINRSELMHRVSVDDSVLMKR